MDIDIEDLSDEHIVFNLSGIDAPLANAFRRILIAEIPTMAIDKIHLYQNTSVIPDEVLAHRLGLIPVFADPRKFEFLQDAMDENNTIVFTLKVKCEWNPEAVEESSEKDKFINAEIYSGHLSWVPQGGQALKFKDFPIAPILDDILIAKLRPGQEIEAEIFCYKGIGRTHAKWSPVSTASYKLKPVVELSQEIKGSDAEKLVATCPMGVFDIEEIKGKKQASVRDSSRCTMCRECIKDSSFVDKVQIRKLRDQFVFSVESVGMYRPEELLKEALGIFLSKCQLLQQNIEAL